MSMEQGAKQRKAKVSKLQTYNQRRHGDRQRRARRRARTERRAQLQRQYRFRVKVVRRYRALRATGLREKEAASRTLARWQPTEPWHFPLCLSSIRQWHRLATQEGFGALRPKSQRPHTIHYQVPDLVVGIIYTLRTVLGWGGHRIAAELAQRQIGQVSGKTVYQIFERLNLPVKLYALKGRSDGIAYQRYEKRRPNAQWHIDLKHTTLADGSRVYICVLLDDYSRYALAAVAGTEATTTWVAQVAQETLRRAGKPAQVLSDNGREFVSVWEESLTKFGQLLAEAGIEHLTTAPYYPQANGKVEAFNKILSRELLERQTFASLGALQLALDRFLTFYNNYRRHSALGWHPPVSRYAGRHLAVRGLAAIPGLEAMAANPAWGVSQVDPPIQITPATACHSTALVAIHRFAPVPDLLPARCAA
jgi:transposase InsO family protein